METLAYYFAIVVTFCTDQMQLWGLESINRDQVLGGAASLVVVVTGFTVKRILSFVIPSAESHLLKENGKSLRDLDEKFNEQVDQIRDIDERVGPLESWEQLSILELQDMFDSVRDQMDALSDRINEAERPWDKIHERYKRKLNNLDQEVKDYYEDRKDDLLRKIYEANKGKELKSQLDSLKRRHNFLYRKNQAILDILKKKRRERHRQVSHAQ